MAIMVVSCEILCCFLSSIINLDACMPPNTGMFRSIRIRLNPSQHNLLASLRIISTASFPFSASSKEMSNFIQYWVMMNLLMYWSSTIRMLGHPQLFRKRGFIWIRFNEFSLINLLLLFFGSILFMEEYSI